MKVDNIRELIVKDRLSKAIDALLEWTSENDQALYSDAIMLSARLQGLEKESRMGTISSSDANISRNRIRQSILWLLQEVQENDSFQNDDNRDGEPGINAGVQPANSGGKALFISYAREDLDYVQKLESHLSSLRNRGMLDTWTDSNIKPGQQWSNVIESNIESADIIMLMVSSDFLASEFIRNHEMPWTRQAYKKNGAIIMPVIVRPCDWQSEFFGKFQAYPRNPSTGLLTSISKWRDKDEAYLEIVKELSKIIPDA